jgi:hypothetical protein
MKILMNFSTRTRSNYSWSLQSGWLAIRMTAEKSNQSGQPVDMTKYPVGTKVFFYRPPSKQEADSKGRRAKHIDHYVGPAKVTKHIGTRSVQLEMEETNGRNITYKRDIGMLLLKRPKMGDPDPTIRQRAALGTRIYKKETRGRVPIAIGEHIIVRDGPLATTWYCAEVSRIERNWMEINYYTMSMQAGKQDSQGLKKLLSCGLGYSEAAAVFQPP